MAEDKQHRLEELLAYREHTLPPDQAALFERHLAECAGCQAALQDADALAQPEEPTLAAKLPSVESSRIGRSYERTRVDRPNRTGRRAFWKALGFGAATLATALALAMTLLAIFQVTFGSRKQDSGGRTPSSAPTGGAP